MNRVIVYPSAEVLDTDLLRISKQIMTGVGRLAMDMLGVGTSVGGAACTPTTPASLAVLIGPGAIYSFQNTDNTAYGSIPPDTTTAHQTIKQGIIPDPLPLTIACPAPTAAGQSINYLIEGQYQEIDTNFNVSPIPYFDSANPTQPFVGPSNSGAVLPDTRSGQFILQAKAGVSAATGSQATPAVDAGWVALYVVTVDFGETTITSADIVVAAGAPFIGVTALNALSKAIADTLYSPIGALTPTAGDARYLQLFARTAAEIAVGVTPVNTSFPSAPFADVRRYGVVGDGAIDDTGRLQLALTVSAALGLAVVIPAGLSVKISGYVQLPSNTTLYILGKLQLTNRASGLFANGASNIRIHGNKIGQITDTTVAGSYVWNPVTTVDAPSIHLRSVTDCLVDGLNISNVSAGIYVTNCTTNTATPGGSFVITQAAPVNVTLRDNNISFTEYGAMSAYRAVNLKYENNYVYRCGDGGIWMMGCVDSSIVGNTRVSPATTPADVASFGSNNAAHPTTWNDEQGIELEACLNILIADNTVTQFWGFGISAANGCNRVTIERNRVSYCENASIMTREGDAVKNANHKVSITNNKITNHGTLQYNLASGAGTGAIRTGETYICDVIDNVIYGYQTTSAINCLGPGAYQASQYPSNPQQASLTVRGNRIEFKSAFQEQDAIAEFQYTSATQYAIAITGQYTSVACDGNHIRTDRYLGSDARISTFPAINLTYTTSVIAGQTYYFPTAASINSNTIQGWGFTGINVLGLAAMTGSGLVVNANVIGASAGSGIIAQFTNCANITNNQVNQPGSGGSGAPGISLAGSSGSMLTGVNASGNTIVGGWNVGANATTFGIALNFCTATNLANTNATNTASGTFSLSNIVGDTYVAGSTGFPRSGAASPAGAITSYYTGEPYLATTGGTWFFATAGNATTWAG